MSRIEVVVVAGTFDMFHVGHLELLRKASRISLVVALVNTDRFVQEFKGITPTINEKDRIKMVDSCKHVFGTDVNDNADLTKTIESLYDNYRVIGVVFGDDYDIESYRKQTGITREWQQKHDIALIQFPRTDGISSTMLRNTPKASE